MNFFIFLMEDPATIGVPAYFQKALRDSRSTVPTTDGGYGIFFGVLSPTDSPDSKQVTSIVTAKVEEYATLLAFPENLNRLPPGVITGFFVQGFNVLLRLLQLTTRKFLTTISAALSQPLRTGNAQAYINFYYAAVVALGISTLCSAFYAFASNSGFSQNLNQISEPFIAGVQDLAGLVVRLFLVASGKEATADQKVREKLNNLALAQANGYLTDLGAQAKALYNAGQYSPLLTFDGDNTQLQLGQNLTPQYGRVDRVFSEFYNDITMAQAPPLQLPPPPPPVRQ